ncbi:branched-chain amino acid aminotransferase [Teichococcus oryzae]|uniref:Probable branched-chain-amino-acid aminotransferase n=1 Tax=Teichococcus oryzae TaxID=1608942 RepID=A0A5B2TI90_9PROT|nr:branched-chain amino acid aminotransferase [Pseudoroseomonas oryzae]KAA2213725.1 branched-chain amino acid aminotransferase [Pseudoroseomonas oryzae]
MAGVFWHNGKWMTEEPKVLGPMDHAFWLGSILFDGARAIRGLVPDLDLHCQRVIRSAHAMMMQPTHSAEQIEALCREGVAMMPADAELYIRPMFFVRQGIGAAQPDGRTTEFILSIYDSPMPDASKGFSACMVPFRRPASDMAPTDAKASCLYPNSSRAAAAAREKGFDNAVMRDHEGNIAEFATSNLMLVKDGVVMTPKPNGTYLAGITRSRVLGLLSAAGVETRECIVTEAMLREADEIFATGNFGKVQYCTNFEGRALPIGPVAQKARALYFEWAERTSRLLPRAA